MSEIKRTEFRSRPFGRTIQIEWNTGAETWPDAVVMVNPRGNSNAGIPAQEDREIAQTIVRACQNHDHLVGVVKDFIADIEAVGVKTVQEDWPDLVPTYRNAKRLLKKLEGASRE
jgi:hypothetical protein